jgi:Gene product 88
MKLLSISKDAKTGKGESYGFLTGVLYLAPLGIAKRGNVCPHASKGCAKACLFTAGRARVFRHINKARVARTRMLFDDRAAFLAQLRTEIAALIRKAARLGLTPAVRLNGTSDIDWQAVAPRLMPDFSEVQFYDYTKSPEKYGAFLDGKLPDNYYLTFSRAENNAEMAEGFVRRGGTATVVFAKGAEFPSFYRGLPVISGDDSDVRFLDPRGVWVGLWAKGKARKDSSGFVVQVA